MFHPSHWFHTHKHNKCLFPFDVCAFEDYASHDVGHFPVRCVMLQSDHEKYMADGIDPRQKLADDDTEGLQQKEEAATKIQALHRGNAERKKGKHHTRVIVFQEGSLGVGIDPPEELDVGAIITEVAEGKQGEELGVEEDWAIQYVFQRKVTAWDLTTPKLTYSCLIMHQQLLLK